MLYSQLCPPPKQKENCSNKDLPILDKETITSVVGFMQKFQSDATFSPPTVEVLYDTDKYNVNVDDDSFGLYDEIEDFEFDDNARNDSNETRDNDKKK